jgi:hypothetical protein
MTDIKDTYFFNYDVALRVAQQQNMIDKYSKQICYYDGEIQENSHSNLIHLPFTNLIQYFQNENKRVPSKINFEMYNITKDKKENIYNNFNNLIETINKNKNIAVNKLIEKIKLQQLSFDEPLRVLCIASIDTEVMQYISKNIYNSFKSLECDAKLEINNEFEDMTVERLVKSLYIFKPHIFISVNSIYSQFLNHNTFQFIWYQDPMPELTNNCQIRLRERDFVFSLVKEIDQFLINKNVIFKRQGFCTNQINSLNPAIIREKKIVFIGSSYANMIHQNEPTSVATDIIIHWLGTGKPFFQDLINYIVEKSNINKEYLTMQLVPAILRDVTVLWLCNIKTNYKVEIYGKGWDKYEEALPFYKGILNYGEDIAKVYNSATYAFAPHNLYILQQRVFEATASGAIPIVYDCREISDENNYNEALCYFNTFQSLEKILQNDVVPKKDFTKLLKENSYDGFSKRLLNIVKIEINK